jgi:cysteine-rich repeat protein
MEFTRLWMVLITCSLFVVPSGCVTIYVGGSDDDDTAVDDDDSPGDDDDSAHGDDDDSAHGDDDDSAHGDDDDSSALSAVCGDSLLGAGESCDDANQQDGDGCSSVCQIEPQCTAGCLQTSDCSGAQTCVGRPSSVAGATGQCEDTATNVGWPPPTCSSSQPCPSGQACLGEFFRASWSENDRWCVDGWFAKHFYSYDQIAIPDGGASLSSTVVACGLATVPVDIVVTLHLDHPRSEDLVVILEDPNGQQGTVLSNETWTPGPITTFVGSGDDTVNGQWTLHVSDTVSGETGQLIGWSVYLLSRWD